MQLAVKATDSNTPGYSCLSYQESKHEKCTVYLITPNPAVCASAFEPAASLFTQAATEGTADTSLPPSGCASFDVAGSWFSRNIAVDAVSKRLSSGIGR